MALIEVMMPQMGESITEGTIVKWYKQLGDTVMKDETLLEISTDKVDSEISSPASGVLSQIMAEESTTVPVQTPIAVIETEGAASTPRIPSPPREPLQPSHALPPPVATPAAVPEIGELRKKYPPPLYDVVPMTSIMQKMAAHMVKSVSVSPHVAAHHEADLTAIVAHRAENLAAFEAKEGFKLTYTPYIIAAVIAALQKYPLVNSSIEGTTIIRKNFINLGIAVASESGLIVPVIKHAEEKNILGIARTVNDLVTRTRKKNLTPDDVRDGTFTITNYGIFGTTIGTPIINQPQVAILGTGAIKPRVSVVNNALAIRSIAYFTLSFDHRIIDGELGGRFLEAVIGYLQSFDTTMKF
jgi:pyruvate dehydrogenase E2 component (dihydrolipoamide acetyltransferase)